MEWLVLKTNPEPWAVGPASAGINKSTRKPYAKIAADPTTAVYQNAVREQLDAILTLRGLTREEVIGRGYNRITFYLWRQLATYSSNSGRKVQRHQADATNIQKATEDALQGILIANDRDVREIRTVIIDQGASVKDPCVVICLDHAVYMESVFEEIPEHVLEEALEPTQATRPLFTETGSVNVDLDEGLF